MFLYPFSIRLISGLEMQPCKLSSWQRAGHTGVAVAAQDAKPLHSCTSPPRIDSHAAGDSAASCSHTAHTIAAVHTHSSTEKQHSEKTGRLAMLRPCHARTHIRHLFVMACHTVSNILCQYQTTNEVLKACSTGSQHGHPGLSETDHISIHVFI